MKLKTLVTVMLLTASSLFAGEKFDKLTTVDGKTYNKVEVTKKTPANVSIMHEGGLARIPFSQLDAATIKALGGYDPKAAAEFDKAEKAQLAAMEASLNAELAKMAKSGKTESEQLQEYQKQVQTNKAITPEEKAKRLQLVNKRLDTLKLQRAKGLR